MTVAHPRPNGLRGRVRPGPTWRRYDAAVLRLHRLAADVEDEADRHAEDSPIRAEVDTAATSLRHAADWRQVPTEQGEGTGHEPVP